MPAKKRTQRSYTDEERRAFVAEYQALKATKSDSDAATALGITRSLLNGWSKKFGSKPRGGVVDRYTEEFKRNAVALAIRERAKTPPTSWESIHGLLGLSKSTGSVYYWTKQPKYNPNGQEVRTHPRGLPTKPRGRVASLKAKSLIPTAFNCPHCGGSVTLPTLGA